MTSQLFLLAINHACFTILVNIELSACCREVIIIEENSFIHFLQGDCVPQTLSYYNMVESSCGSFSHRIYLVPSQLLEYFIPFGLYLLL